MGIVAVERLVASPIYGIYLATFDDAITLMTWAHEDPAYVCRLYDKYDGTWEIQIEGHAIETTVATEGRWLMLDGNKFLTLSQEEFDNTYRVV